MGTMLTLWINPGASSDAEFRYFHNYSDHEEISRRRLNILDIDIQAYEVGNAEISGLFFLPTTITEESAKAISDVHHAAFPKIEITAFFIVYFSVTLTGVLILYAKVSHFIVKCDKPDYMGIVCLGAGILDVTSDYQVMKNHNVISCEIFNEMAYQLAVDNHPLFPIVLGCCSSSYIFGTM